MKSAYYASKLKAVLLVLTCMLAVTSICAAGTVQINSEQLEGLIAQNVPVVDVRTANEWRATGIIPGSHLLTFFDEQGNYNVHNWLTRFTEIAKPHDPVAIICAVGNRSEVISGFLTQQLGYQKVYNVTWGIENWIQQTRPVDNWP